MKNTGKNFMDQTRYAHLSRSDQMQGLPAPPLEKPAEEYGSCIALPSIENLDLPSVDLCDAIASRRSIRHYLAESVTQDELSYLLWATQGIEQVQDPFYTLRTVPSAGGRHAFETYLSITNVTGLEPGIYRYLPFSHQLIQIRTNEHIADLIMKACLDQPFIKTAAIVFLWSCVIYRMAWRYSERAYRLVHLDAGHVCQNLYLAAGQVRCGVCAIAAFDDDLIADILQIDGSDEFVIYCAAVGKALI